MTGDVVAQLRGAARCTQDLLEAGNTGTLTKTDVLCQLLINQGVLLAALLWLVERAEARP